LEVLERKRARRAGEQTQKDQPVEDAPDPMADLDELEAHRQKRARRDGVVRRIAK
jgi:hypothetical protein